MALSGFRDFIHTRGTIIQAAFRKLGIGERSDSSEVSQAAEALNTLQLGWQKKGVFLWTIDPSSTAMQDGLANYTENNVIAILPEGIYWQDSDGNDHPIRVITDEEYDNIPDKDASGPPVYLHMRHEVLFTGVSAINMSLWPVPGADEDTLDLHYRMILRLQDFDATGDNPDFPVWASDALIYGLAAELAYEYSLPPIEKAALEAKAEKLFQEVLDSSTQSTGSIQFGIDRG